jgi:hypothetical protein
MSDWRVRMVALWALVGAVVGFATPVLARIPNPDHSSDGGGSAMPAALAREGGCEPGMTPAAEVESNTQRLVGQVVALDAQGGELTLSTRAGKVSLAASADTLSQLDIGDVVVVELIPETESASGRADCR